VRFVRFVRFGVRGGSTTLRPTRDVTGAGPVGVPLRLRRAEILLQTGKRSQRTARQRVGFEAVLFLEVAAVIPFADAVLDFQQ
jgi:hypothetical protein